MTVLIYNGPLVICVDLSNVIPLSYFLLVLLHVCVVNKLDAFCDWCLCCSQTINIFRFVAREGEGAGHCFGG
jgi:hypothetical protein